METKTRPTTFQLHEAQAAFVLDRHPYIGFVGGRGSGKSHAGAVRLYHWASLEPGPYGMYGRTYGVMGDTIQRTFLEVATPGLVALNRSSQQITLRNGSIIYCRGLDDPERARGPNLRGAVWDEASLCPEEAFKILIAALRWRGKQGWLGCSFTPKEPRHWTSRIFGPAHAPEVATYHASSRENPYLPDGWAAQLARQYTVAYAARELEGRFVDLAGGLFQREWFNRIAPRAPEAQARVRVRFWDLAATPAGEDTPDPDWTAGALLSWVDDTWYIEDVRHARLTPRGNEALVKQTAAIDGRGVAIRIEQEGGASGKSLCDYYARHILPGYDVQGISKRADKMTNAQAFAAAAERGDVVVVAGAWNGAWLDELCAFGTESGVHDDQVDATCSAFNALVDEYVAPGIDRARTAPSELRDVDEEIARLEAELDAAEHGHHRGNGKLVHP